MKYRTTCIHCGGDALSVYGTARFSGAPLTRRGYDLDEAADIHVDSTVFEDDLREMVHCTDCGDDKDEPLTAYQIHEATP